MDYSLLVMESTGMMKMATGEGFPLQKGDGTGSRLVFGGYRGFQRRNSRSRLVSRGFSIYRRCWSRGQVKGVFGLSTRRGARPVGGRPPPSWTPRVPYSMVLKSPVRILLHKYLSRRFHSVWTPFDIPLLQNPKIGKKTTIWTGPFG